MERTEILLEKFLCASIVERDSLLRAVADIAERRGDSCQLQILAGAAVATALLDIERTATRKIGRKRCFVIVVVPAVKTIPIDRLVLGVRKFDRLADLVTVLNAVLVILLAERHALRRQRNAG